jgi:hypothetical protein
MLTATTLITQVAGQLAVLAVKVQGLVPQYCEPSVAVLPSVV